MLMRYSFVHGFIKINEIFVLHQLPYAYDSEAIDFKNEYILFLVCIYLLQFHSCSCFMVQSTTCSRHLQFALAEINFNALCGLIMQPSEIFANQFKYIFSLSFQSSIFSEEIEFKPSLNRFTTTAYYLSYLDGNCFD